MGKQDDNIKTIIDFLSEGPKTADEIIKKVGFTSSSWKKYTGHVNKRLDVEGKRLRLLDHSYSIVNKESEKTDLNNCGIPSGDREYIDPSSKETVMRVLLLNALSQKASVCPATSKSGLMTSKDLTEKIFLNSEYSDNEYIEDDKVVIKYPYKSIDSILGIDKISENNKTKKKGLIQEGFVTMFDAPRLSQRSFDLTTKAPVYLKIGYESGTINLWDIKNSLQYGRQGYAFPDVLKEIEDIVTVFDDDDIYNIDEYYRNIGIRGNQNSSIERMLNKLNKLDFKKYLLNIEYNSAHASFKSVSSNKKNAKKKNSYKFAVGLIVYVSDKDRLYLLGKNKGSDKILILNAEKIKNISEMKIKNDIYGLPEFVDIYNEMFSISVDEPFELKVEFQNRINIYEKIKRMSVIRPNAVISLKANTEKTIIYYEKRVRGIEDVARWLRAFGRSAKVIKPDILRERMKTSIIKSLENYGEELGDE